MITTGSKAQVFHGSAKHTSGGLKKQDLMRNKRGRIVSKKQHASGKKQMVTIMKSKHANVFRSNQQKVRSRTMGKSKRKL